MTLEQNDEQTRKARAAAEPTPRWRLISYGRRVAIGVAAYVVMGVPLVLYAPAALLNNWVPGLTPEDQGKLLGTAGNLVLLSLGGVIAVVTVGLSLSRHRQELDAAERDRQRLSDDQNRERARLTEVDDQRHIETERLLRQRFITTAQLLSETAPVNRQAALYALGSLADDWNAIGKPDEVQVCIELLTGYLRAPRSSDMLLALDPEEAHYLDPEDYYDAQRTTPQEVSVKQAGYTVIRNHLQPGATNSWHDRQLDLTRAHIDFSVELLRMKVSRGGALDLRGAKIGRGGMIDLGAAQIRNGGSVYLTDAVITGDGCVDLLAAQITNHGKVDFRKANISRGHVNLTHAKIAKFGTVIFSNSVIRRRGSVNLRGAAIGNGGTVDLTGASISEQAKVILKKVTISDGGNVELADSAISDGGKIDLAGASVADGGRVDFAGAAIGTRGHVDLTDVAISDGATVNLDAIKIVRGGSLVQPEKATATSELS
ncbi:MULTISPECIES: hypothetical protein [unclassified Rathayibacter]|uniref:hypothetical protein n=1 Tax=unclassified Rathayibacter TaxID=2609250 RepID=UPI0011B0B4E6|nr:MULTISPECIES: hypothetical protein [unclassified Rathayibacter]